MSYNIRKIVKSNNFSLLGALAKDFTLRSRLVRLRARAHPHGPSTILASADF